MANLGRLHLAVSTSQSDISGTDCCSLEELSGQVVPLLREFKIALETPSQNFIIA